MISPDHRIDLPGTGAGGEVGAIFLQRLVFPLRIGVGDFLRTADLFNCGLGFPFIQPRILEQLPRRRIPFQGTEQEMLHREEIVSHLLADAIRRVERRPQPGTDLRLRRGALHADLLGKRGSRGRARRVGSRTAKKTKKIAVVDHTRLPSATVTARA